MTAKVSKGRLKQSDFKAILAYLTESEWDAFMCTRDYRVSSQILIDKAADSLHARSLTEHTIKYITSASLLASAADPIAGIADSVRATSTSPARMSRRHGRGRCAVLPSVVQLLFFSLPEDPDTLKLVEPSPVQPRLH